MTGQPEFSQLLPDLTQRVDDQINQQRAKGPEDRLLEELELISEELHELQDRWRSNQLPPIAERKLRAARIVLLYWPAQDDLAEQISKLAYLYEQGFTGTSQDD